MDIPESPHSRQEEYLAAIAGLSSEIPESPHSRQEAYLDYIVRVAVKPKVMPEPDERFLNVIVQYAGETTAEYTNGYFYRCIVEDGIYKWSNIPVQPTFGETLPVATEAGTAAIYDGNEWKSVSGYAYTETLPETVHVSDISTDLSQSEVYYPWYAASLYNEFVPVSGEIYSITYNGTRYDGIVAMPMYTGVSDFYAIYVGKLDSDTGMPSFEDIPFCIIWMPEIPDYPFDTGTLLLDPENNHAEISIDRLTTVTETVSVEDFDIGLYYAHLDKIGFSENSAYSVTFDGETKYLSSKIFGEILYLSDGDPLQGDFTYVISFEKSGTVFELVTTIPGEHTIELKASGIRTISPTLLPSVTELKDFSDFITEISSYFDEITGYVEYTIGQLVTHLGELGLEGFPYVRDAIAQQYSSSKTYNIGDYYFSYSNGLYVKLNSGITSTTIGDELTSIRSMLITELYQYNKAYPKGSIVLYNNELYKSNKATQRQSDRPSEDDWDKITLLDALNNKVEKVEGKVLSTNDFTDEFREKLSNLPQSDWNELDSNNEQYIKNKPLNRLLPEPEGNGNIAVTTNSAWTKLDRFPYSLSNEKVIFEGDIELTDEYTVTDPYGVSTVYPCGSFPSALPAKIDEQYSVTINGNSYRNFDCAVSGGIVANSYVLIGKINYSGVRTPEPTSSHPYTIKVDFTNSMIPSASTIIMHNGSHTIGEVVHVKIIDTGVVSTDYMARHFANVPYISRTGNQEIVFIGPLVEGERYNFSVVYQDEVIVSPKRKTINIFGSDVSPFEAVCIEDPYNISNPEFIIIYNPEITEVIDGIIGTCIFVKLVDSPNFYQNHQIKISKINYSSISSEYLQKPTLGNDPLQTAPFSSLGGYRLKKSIAEKYSSDKTYHDGDIYFHDNGKLYEFINDTRIEKETSISEIINRKYKSLKKLYASQQGLTVPDYIYEIAFDKIPPIEDVLFPIIGGCTTYVDQTGGLMYRYLDWTYSYAPSFHVICPTFEGMAFLSDAINNSMLNQLPYHIVDGVNMYGVHVSMHVLYNDWNWHGVSNGIPLYLLPYYVMTKVKSVETLEEDLSDIIPNLCTSSTLDAQEYLLQFLVTDRFKTYAILPPESGSGVYEVVDISSNPKLTNFRWVPDITVSRSNLQERPTGVERWNMIQQFSAHSYGDQLFFSKAYVNANRLSEFIGMNGTTKDSSDEELMELYNSASAYWSSHTDNEKRSDGLVWQTMHYITYYNGTIWSLNVQENTNNVNVTHPDYAQNKIEEDMLSIKNNKLSITYFKEEE